MKKREPTSTIRTLSVARRSGSEPSFGDPTLVEYLAQYEKRLIRSGKTPSEAKRSKEELAAAIVCESPREREIRDALAADHKAERHLRFFERQGHPIQAQITKLTMWARADLWSATMSVLDESTQQLIPRDRVLKLLRERRDQGATDADLARLGPCNYVGELRRRRFNIKAVKETNGSWRYVLREEGGKRSHKLVTQSQEYTNIARAIENLGKPSQLIEAWRFSLSMARLLRHHQNIREKSSTFREPRRTFEDDFLGYAGQHLKRWTYLMAVAWTTARRRQKSDIPDLAQRLYETFRKRLIRSGHAKK